MRLLLDENLPHQLRHGLPGHDCYTVAFMSWGGIENGELLARAASTGFDALLAKDAGVQYEQNLTNLPLSVLILDGSNIPLVSVGTVGDVVTLGGNVASFAGTTAGLVISTVTPTLDGPELWAWVDSVSFSSEAIPEPLTGALVSIASVVAIGFLRDQHM